MAMAGSRQRIQPHLPIDDEAEVLWLAASSSQHFVLHERLRLHKPAQQLLQRAGPESEEAAALVQPVPDEPDVLLGPLAARLLQKVQKVREFLLGSPWRHCDV